MELKLNGSEPVQDTFSREGTIAYAVICSVIIFLGISMNVIVVYIYKSKKLQQSKFNLCLAHLAAANIMEHIGFLPYLIIDLKTVSTENPILQSFICGIVDGISFLFAFSFTEGYILCYMSYTRYKVIKHPLKSFFVEKQMKFFIRAAWIVGLLWLTPNTMSWKLHTKHGFCVRKHTILDSIYLPFLWTFILIAPFVFVGVILVLTTIEMHRKSVKTTDRCKVKHRSRLSKLFAFLYLSHAICWFPFGIYFILSVSQFYGQGIDAEYKKLKAVRLVMVPCLLEGIMNIFVYGFHSKEFRVAYIKILLRRRYNKVVPITKSNKTDST